MEEIVAVAARTGERKPFCRVLYVQVLIGIVVAIRLGLFYPKLAVEMKPLGDAFMLRIIPWW